MLARVILVHFCLLGAVGLLAQQPLDDRYPEPVKGDSVLIESFHKINFTEAQLKWLCQFRWTINYNIDKSGKAYLSGIEANGNINKAIVDSLAINAFKMKTIFYPRILNGRPVNSMYSLSFLFNCPGKEMNRLRIPFEKANFKREDVKSFTKSSKGVEANLSVMTSHLAGKLSSYLDPGPGFKMELLVPCFDYSIGLLIALSNHNRKYEYPDITSSKQDDFTSIYYLGLGVNRAFRLSTRQDLLIQFELMVAGQTIIHRNNLNIKGTVIEGWSPGLTVNYALQIGQNQFWNTGKLKADRKRPAIKQHYLNVHAGIRQLNFPVSEANGWAFEVGIGYRFSQRLLKDYELN